MGIGDVSEVERIPVLREPLVSQLVSIEPSVDREMTYFPCEMRLHSGAVVSRVYATEAITYIRYWGVWPWEDEHKEHVDLADVAAIAESPHRMPARLANRMYAAGESGMGGCIFSLLLRGGNRLPYVCGNAVDFVDLPADVSWSDVDDLLPHEGRDAQAARRCGDYSWCLFRVDSSDPT